MSTRRGAVVGSYGRASSRCATRRPKRSTAQGPARQVARIITTTALTSVWSSSPRSYPTRMMASVPAACGTVSPNTVHPSAAS